MKSETYYCDRCGDRIGEQGQAFVLYEVDFVPPTMAEVQRIPGGDFCGAECVLKHINAQLCPGVEHKPSEPAQCGAVSEVAHV
jgi:hypothetical protein